MYKNKKSGIVGIIITIIILILIVIFSNGEQNSNFLQNAANNLIMPIQNGLTFLKNKIHSNNSFFENINNIQKENEELKQKNNDLEEKLREFESIKAENHTLKEYMKLTEKYTDYKTVGADVISRDISNYSKTIVINAGKKSGIQPNMTVIATEGLVGYVISSTDTTAKVQTIVDSSSSTSCILSSSRDSIVCKGMLEGRIIVKP